MPDTTQADEVLAEIAHLRQALTESQRKLRLVKDDRSRLRAALVQLAGASQETLENDQGLISKLAGAMDRWPHPTDEAADLGRLNYDTGLTAGDVAAARARVQVLGHLRDAYTLADETLRLVKA